MPARQLRFLTREAWRGEVEHAAHPRWHLTKAWVEQDSPMCYADVADNQTGATRRVTLARDRFGTPEARRVEILRQLQVRE